MSGKKKYSNEFKFQIVQEYLKDKNGGFKTLAAKYGIGYSQIKRWVNLYRKGGAEYLANAKRTYGGDFKVHKETVWTTLLWKTFSGCSNQRCSILEVLRILTSSKKNL